MKNLVAVLLLTAMTSFAYAKNPSNPGFEIKGMDSNGSPTFISGQIGVLGSGAADVAAKNFLKSKGDLFGAAGTEDFDTKSVRKDELGLTHVKFQQKLRGLPVVGAEMTVHSDANGIVYAMNGRFAADRDLPRAAKIDGREALVKAAAQAGITDWTALAAPSLTYVVNEKGTAFLAWTTRASYTSENGPEIDQLYADATSGDLVLRNPEFHRARNRQTHNCNNGTTLPGTLVRSETTGASGDVALDAAHDYAGGTYDYYYQVHGRDSYNGAGATLKSSVHYSSNYNNAFWNGTQMVYGDGDGTTFIALSRAFDVVAHELTHAVTDYSADLVYSNESGALNEATSDIMAAAAEARRDGSINGDTWLVGEDIYTPATAGDALRNMADPAGSGDYDYYPTRYTGTQDNGGVHWNSGIANLAFKLMVTGGTHPRGKTTVSVPAFSATGLTSMDMGGKIWYRALTVYMTSSTNFQGARNATAQAAADLYGGTTGAAYNTVQKGWDAVGVPGGTTPPPSGTTTLTNGVAVTGIGASTGTWKHYKIAVPSGQSKLDIVQSGGTGDADLYVKLGSQPTSTSYTYRPYLSGNNETVSVTNPAAGDWYISIYAYSTYASVSLKATYTGTAPPPACTTYTGSLAGTGSQAFAPSSSGYTSSISGTHTGKLTGTGTDFDLYLQKWNGSSWAIVARGETSTSTENVSYSGTSGTYRWRVYSYSGSGTYSLCTTKP